MITTTPHAPTQGEENFIDMLYHMSVLNKKKHNLMTSINMISMPTMGVTTNPKTTSFSTWTRHLIANHILMLMIKVTKNNLGVISGIIHDKTNMRGDLANAQDEEANHVRHREPPQRRKDHRQHHHRAPSEGSVQMQHQPNVMVGRGRPPHP
jgi:hypothetical protein